MQKYSNALKTYKKGYDILVEAESDDETLKKKFRLVLSEIFRKMPFLNKTETINESKFLLYNTDKIHTIDPSIFNIYHSRMGKINNQKNMFKRRFKILHTYKIYRPDFSLQTPTRSNLKFINGDTIENKNIYQNHWRLTASKNFQRQKRNIQDIMVDVKNLNVNRVNLRNTNIDEDTSFHRILGEIEEDLINQRKSFKTASNSNSITFDAKKRLENLRNSYGDEITKFSHFSGKKIMLTAPSQIFDLSCKSHKMNGQHILNPLLTSREKKVN